jgi:CPA2 family monovalent cation:H+ antiporter-2
VARTRYVRDIEELHSLGANEVVPEEFETSLEIFVRVLRRYSVPESRIREQAEEARRDHYELLRERGTHFTRVDGYLSPFASRLELKTVTIRSGTLGAGATIESIDLRRQSGANIVATIRQGVVEYDIDDDTQVLPGDELVLIGEPTALEKAAAYLHEMAVVSGEQVASTISEQRPSA